MVYHGLQTMFQNNMLFYHGFPVSKHHGFYGISWYFTMVYLFQNTMVFTMVYFHKGIAQFHGPWTLGIVNLIVMLIFQMLSETMR